MTLHELINLTPAELNDKNKEELTEIVEKFAPKANSRLDKLSRMKLPSNALMTRGVYVKDENDPDGGEILSRVNGRFEYKEFGLYDSDGNLKNSNQLRSEVKYLKLFLKAKTSQAVNARQSIKDLFVRVTGDQDLTYRKLTTKLNYDESREFWSQYSKVLDEASGIIRTRDNIAGKIPSEKVISMLYEKYSKNKESASDDTLAMTITKAVKNMNAKMVPPDDENNPFNLARNATRN